MSAEPSLPAAVSSAGPDSRTASNAALILELTRSAMMARSVPEAVQPTLARLVQHSAAAGAAYFQIDGQTFNYHARAASGQMPQGPVMEAIAAHGLPAETPLMRALRLTRDPLFFNDTARSPEAAGFPDLGVRSLAAAPVCGVNGDFLGAFLMHTFVQHDWRPIETDLFALVAATMTTVTARLVAEEQMQRAHEASIRALGLALELRDDETSGHTDRVSMLALALAGSLQLSEDDMQALRWGASLHDIGKLAVPDAVLLKPGRLDEREWEIMRSHVEVGERFAQALSFLPIAARAVITSHHERWDGSGYPHGLAGEAIPLSARIFAICDVYDALTSERPYKVAWSEQDALDEIRQQAGHHFDPTLVSLFLHLRGHSGPESIHAAD